MYSGSSIVTEVGSPQVIKWRLAEPVTVGLTQAAALFSLRLTSNLFTAAGPVSQGPSVIPATNPTPVSYTHLTLPTKRIV